MNDNNKTNELIISNKQNNSVRPIIHSKDVQKETNLDMFMDISQCRYVRIITCNNITKFDVSVYIYLLFDLFICLFHVVICVTDRQPDRQTDDKQH